MLSAQEVMAGAAVSCPTCNTVLEVPRPPHPKPPTGNHVGPVEDAGGQPKPEEALAREAPVQFGADKESTRDEMDMTPMVDVTFLLLIFFMVTAAFSMQKSFEVPAPDESQPSTQVKTLEDFEDDPHFVVVRIDAYNTYRVIAADWDREAPSEQELLVQLREAKRGDSQGIVPNRLLVVANGEALHEKVVTVLDAGATVGMEEVKMVTVEEDE